MSDTLDTQLQLHEAISALGVWGLRRAATELDPDPEIFGMLLSEDEIRERLSSVIPVVWPEFTLGDAPAEQLAEFRERAIERLYSLSEETDFVPAALWTYEHREELFEHLRVELRAIAMGVRMEPVWWSLWEMEETELRGDVFEAGMDVKLRAVGDFLIGFTRDRFRDRELHAEDFFPAGDWLDARHAQLVEVVKQTNAVASKRTAHLTTHRPLPDDRGMRRGSYNNHLERVIELLRRFTDEVADELLPEWWTDWFHGFEQHHGRARWVDVVALRELERLHAGGELTEDEFKTRRQELFLP